MKNNNPSGNRPASKRTTRPFSPNAPKRLVAAFRKKASCQRLADDLEVNVQYVYRLLFDGIEPTDKTPTGQAVRVKLFLTKTIRKPRAKRVMPLLGSDCWKCLAFKKLKPKKWNTKQKRNQP